MILTTRFGPVKSTTDDVQFSRYMLVMCHILKHLTTAETDAETDAETVSVSSMASAGFTEIDVSATVTLLAWDLGVAVSQLAIDDVIAGPWVYSATSQLRPQLMTSLLAIAAAATPYVIADHEVFIELCRLCETNDETTTFVYHPKADDLNQGQVYGRAISAAQNHPSLTFCGPSVAETETTTPVSLSEFGTLNRLGHSVSDPSLRQELQMMVCLHKKVAMTAAEMAQWINIRINKDNVTSHPADTETTPETNSETATTTEPEFKLTELDVDNDKRMWSMMLAALDTLTV